MIYWARFRFWLHIQLAAAPAASHGDYNLYSHRGLILIGCVCGKVFWKKKGEGY
jgi:hypothetical protein